MGKGSRTIRKQIDRRGEEVARKEEYFREASVNEEAGEAEKAEEDGEEEEKEKKGK